jgi:hypothetical protein
MSNAGPPAVRKRSNLSAKPLKYSDGQKTWEALPGQPNGAFTIPGDPDTLYSLDSFYEMIRRHCRKVKVVDQDHSVEDAGTATFEDALPLVGEARPRPTVAPPKGAKVTRASENRTKILNYLHQVGSKGATKRQIADALSPDVTFASVSALVTNMDEIEVSGKDGAQNLYRVKSKQARSR